MPSTSDARPVALGVALSGNDGGSRVALAREAEALGCESLWLEAREGGDAFASLREVVESTSRVRVGIWAYALAARHPLESAREIAALDRSSGGRVEIGLADSDGAALAEALTLCKRLWADPSVEHRGACFALDEIALEPRPSQKPWPRIHLAAASERSLDRAARMADGWLALDHTPASIAAPLVYLRDRRERAETLDGRFQISARAEPWDLAELGAWRAAGVDRLIVSPAALRRLRA